MTEPTQVQRPVRSTIRTIFQAFVGLCALAPILVGATDVDVEQLPWLVIALGVAAAVTRIMALPGVNDWLGRFVPWLSADAETARQRDHGSADVLTVLTFAGAMFVILASIALGVPWLLLVLALTCFAVAARPRPKLRQQQE